MQYYSFGGWGESTVANFINYIEISPIGVVLKIIYENGYGSRIFLL